MLKDRICQFCNTTFNNIEGRTFSNHVKWCNSNPSVPVKIKCEKCGEHISSNNMSYHNCEVRMRKCDECKITFEKGAANERFCSHSCSAKYFNRQRKNNGYVSKLKGTKWGVVNVKCISCNCDFGVRKNNLGNIKECDSCRGILRTSNRAYRLLSTNCVICGKETFYHSDKKVKKTCSRKCCSIHLSNLAKANPNCGGETNYKKFSYKGIAMDSSWEVKVAETMDSLSIKWERSKKLCLWWLDENEKKRRYIPDFYLPDYDVYLDTKNKYLMKQDAYKIKRVIENNNVSLIVGDIEYVENYIKNLNNSGA